MQRYWVEVWSQIVPQPACHWLPTCRHSIQVVLFFSYECRTRRWNLWFPSAGVFAEVHAGRATGTQEVYLQNDLCCDQYNIKRTVMPRRRTVTRNVLRGSSLVLSVRRTQMPFQSLPLVYGTICHKTSLRHLYLLPLLCHVWEVMLVWRNAGGVGRKCNFETVSGFTACCQCCNRPVVINTAPPDHGPVSCDTYWW